MTYRRAGPLVFTALEHTIRAMPELLAALEAFLQEHRRCGVLNSGVEAGWVWMTCECGADLLQDARPDPPGGVSFPFPSP